MPLPPSAVARVVRRFALAICACATLIPSLAAAAPTCWRPPVDAPIAEPFRAPACPYCPGHRGVAFSVEATSVVRAVEGGVVTWAGTVVDTRYVVVEHVDGRRVTYGRLDSVSVERGSTVLRGHVVGDARGSLYFGLRVGDRYVDPAPFLGDIVGVRRLVPLDGAAWRPAPPPRLRCAGVPVPDSAR